MWKIVEAIGNRELFEPLIDVVDPVGLRRHRHRARRPDDGGIVIVVDHELFECGFIEEAVNNFPVPAARPSVPD